MLRVFVLMAILLNKDVIRGSNIEMFRRLQVMLGVPEENSEGINIV
jgi:hypothetical protein